ncbi:MAG: DUF3347 domain-containing protein [Owenweeksia sp.]|nr:DUF3347 domain-containing protein [Owenweeksia sp.]
MKTSKSILFSMAIVGLTLLGACNDNPQNEHGDHDHEHHEGMEDREGAHDHSQMEEHFDEVEQEEGMHSQHKSLRENFAHQDIITLDHPYQADQDVQKDLKAVVNAYLVLKNGLVNDDINAADKAAGDMAATVKAVEGGSLNSDGQKAWTQHASLYTDKLAELQHVKSIEEKRSYFSHIFGDRLLHR